MLLDETGANLEGELVLRYDERQGIKPTARWKELRLICNPILGPITIKKDHLLGTNVMG